VQEGEYRYATNTNERTAGSYFNHNFVPASRRRPVRFRDGRAEIVAGIRVLPTPGHTPHHQSILIESGGERALFIADLAPTASHLPLAWIMGYDVEPLVTLRPNDAFSRRRRPKTG
jgi:glyoxylase-like metal-dependent hydrolase (beta-lactamase superfamily II)